jgi:hypothetical protein
MSYIDDDCSYVKLLNAELITILQKEKYYDGFGESERIVMQSFCDSKVIKTIFYCKSILFL